MVALCAASQLDARQAMRLSCSASDSSRNSEAMRARCAGRTGRRRTAVMGRLIAASSARIGAQPLDCRDDPVRVGSDQLHGSGRRVLRAARSCRAGSSRGTPSAGASSCMPPESVEDQVGAAHGLDHRAMGQRRDEADAWPCPQQAGASAQRPWDWAEAARRCAHAAGELDQRARPDRQARPPILAAVAGDQQAEWRLGHQRRTRLTGSGPTSAASASMPLLPVT